MSSKQTPLPSIGNMFRLIFEKWYGDNIPRHAAVLAFYALFAVAPILLLAVEVMGLVYGRAAAEAQTLTQVTSIVNSPETAEFVKILLRNILPSSASWWVTTGFIAVLLFGASSFFGELKITLNQIWGIPLAHDNGIWGPIFARLQAVLMVLLGSLLIFCGLVITQWLTIATDWATTSLNLGPIYRVSYLTMLFTLLTIVFALVYKFVPDIEIAWQDVWIGAAATALLISITRLLISWYFSHSRVSTMFGAAGALVVILLWVYYSAQIFFLGAEFTYIYSYTFGAKWHGDEESQPAQEQSVVDPTPTEDYPQNSYDEVAKKTLPPRPTDPVKLAVENIELDPVDPDTVDLVEPSPAKRTRLAEIYQRVRHPRPVSDDVEQQILDVIGESPPAESTNRVTAVRHHINSFYSRVKQVVAFPIRVIRPVREVIVAVGVIGAISLAALAGIPWWRKRDSDVESPPETVE